MRKGERTNAWFVALVMIVKPRRERAVQKEHEDENERELYHWRSGPACRLTLVQACIAVLFTQGFEPGFVNSGRCRGQVYGSRSCHQNPVLQ